MDMFIATHNYHWHTMRLNSQTGNKFCLCSL